MITNNTISVESELSYYSTQEFKDTLLNQLENIPANYQLVPIVRGTKKDKGKVVGLKAPLGEAWGTRLIPRQEIKEAILSGAAWGFGLKLGVNGDGILAIDVDGTDPKNGLESILAGRQLPKTVQFASGKPDRCQYLFLVPQDQWGGLERKAAKFGNSDLDFRWNYNKIDGDGVEKVTSFQSCLPATFHSLEFGVYSWVEGCSPEDTEIAQVPDYLLAYWKELINPVKTERTNTRKPKPSNTHSLLSKKNNGDFDRMLASAVDKVAGCLDGGRNVNLNNKVCTLVGRFPDRVEEIQAALTDAAIACGLPTSEIATTLVSATKFGIDSPLAAPREKVSQVEGMYMLLDSEFKNFKYNPVEERWVQYLPAGYWTERVEENVKAVALEVLIDQAPNLTQMWLDSVVNLTRKKLLHYSNNNESSTRFIPFQNGVYEIATGSFTPEQSPDYGFTWQLPRDYSAVAEPCPHFDRWISWMCCGDAGLADVLIAFLAAILTSRWDLHRFLFLYGGGGNGKSTFNELAALLVGEENTRGSRLHEFMSNKHTAAGMENKKLIIFADEDGGHKQVGKLKSLTGHDFMDSELKFKNSHQFRYEGMVIIAANSAIFNGAHDGSAMSRRMIAFPCLAELEVVDQINQIPLLTSELSAITTMLLGKSKEWVKNTLATANQIPAIAELTKELRSREDSVSAFIDEFVTVAADAKVGTMETYQNYQLFCKVNGMGTQKQQSFSAALLAALKKLGVKKGLAGIKRTSAYLGVVVDSLKVEEYRNLNKGFQDSGSVSSPPL